MAVYVMMNALTRAVCWTAGVVEGLVAGLLGRDGASGFESMPVIALDEPFGELRAALLGRHRNQIARVLGEPPTASVGFGQSVAGAAAPATFWQASTWYYPFDHVRQQAIAIRFVGDRAREVDFIGAMGKRET
ncbi:MAG TPA: hypothetical protein VH475_19650 [Tepidisphaeraceae bacterium]|jgi:hypothetical protein